MVHDNKVIPITDATPVIEKTEHKPSDRLPGSPNEEPRRLSSDRRSKFYSPWHSTRALVTIDGEVVPACVEFDLDEGWARFHVLDDKGHPQLATCGCCIREATRFGKVEVEYVRGNRFF